MTEEVKPILSGTLKPDRVLNIGGVENKRDESGDQMVSVKPLKTFHKHGDMTGEMVGPGSPAFDVPRHRAAQLRANGLVGYANDGDDVIQSEIDTKQPDEKVKPTKDGKSGK